MIEKHQTDGALLVGPVRKIGRPPEDELIRFWKKVRVDENTGCWLWEGSLLNTRGGYGQFWLYHGSNRRVHIFAYEQLVAKVPKGLTIDHLCRNTRCVNPIHMEVVTGTVNTLRGDSQPALNARKTECVRGHSLEGTNLKFRKDGHRQCRKCLAIRSKEYRQRQLVKLQRRRSSVASEGFNGDVGED